LSEPEQPKPIHLLQFKDECDSFIVRLIPNFHPTYDQTQFIEIREPTVPGLLFVW